MDILAKDLPYMLAKPTPRLCCNWDCKNYPSSDHKCFVDGFKCRWFVIANNDNICPKCKCFINTAHTCIL